MAFTEGRGTCKSLYLVGIIEITYSSESFRRKQTTIDVRFQGGQTATKLQHVLLPNISNKEGREAWVMGLDYSKQAVENTYQCHFVLYFVSASIDPSSDIIGSLEHWIDSFIRQDFLRCRFHLKRIRIHGNLFRRFNLNGEPI